VQECGCYALALLSGGSTERSAAIASAGGIQAIMSAMQANRGVVELQRLGKELVDNLKMVSL
jgi:hypothetical protein